jgi:DNA-binding FrmR family transcriptional regulator
MKNTGKKKDPKEKMLIGLKKARTSLDRIIAILSAENLDKEGKEEDKCFGIIQQNLSVIGLLKSVNTAMLENHINLYIKEVKKGQMNKRRLEQMKEEILKTVRQAQNK